MRLYCSRYVRKTAVRDNLQSRQRARQKESLRLGKQLLARRLASPKPLFRPLPRPSTPFQYVVPMRPTPLQSSNKPPADHALRSSPMRQVLLKNFDELIAVIDVSFSVATAFPAARAGQL